MPVLLGNQYLKWMDDGPRVYPLRVPLQSRTPGHRQRRIVRESLDYSVRAVTVIGQGVHEISARIRYDENPELLVAMLVAGANGSVLYWFDGIREIPCSLIEPNGDLLRLLVEDEAKPDFEFTIELVLRLLDGTPAGSLVM